GTLEFWCRPHWDPEDGVERVFFDGMAYMHRRQSALRKLGAAGNNQLEFTIAGSDGKPHTVRGTAPLRKGEWHHIAATWSFPRAHLQLFVDGRLVAAEGPGPTPWAYSLTARGGLPGMGIEEGDSRSLPMQAYIGGDRSCRQAAAEADLDEFRISDVVRYQGGFQPLRRQFAVDANTRALFRFENEPHGVHADDDGFVRGHPSCEVPPNEDAVVLQRLAPNGNKDRIESRRVVVCPHPPEALFEANRAETVLPVTRPFADPPDPRFTEYRYRTATRTLHRGSQSFSVRVEGNYTPSMRWVLFEHPGKGPTVLLPRWRANNNVVPFSFETLGKTLGTGARSDAEKAMSVFRYALHTTNYYDGGYCETLPDRHRPRTSYTLIKALNIYPFDQCGPLNYTLRKLFLTAGISSNDASGTHHQFQEAFYGGRRRLFDLSPRKFWLNRDNQTVASRRAFEEDMYLKVRQETEVYSALRGRPESSRYGRAERPHRMDFPLRAGEQV
ncbi:MAG: LamG domain-containing protein, partial [Armatimonadota bacterium]|nr:LamG domain-containing protein [Armatimonadota bacterium]